MQPDTDTSVEQLVRTPRNPRCSKYPLRYNPQPFLMMITDNGAVPLLSTERIRTHSGNPRNVLCN